MKKLHKVAIVDPNKELSRAYQKRLMLDGYEVYVFDNAQEAIAVIIDLPFDAVISEHKLPDLDFLDFYWSVQSSNGLLKLPFIILTNDEINESVDLRGVVTLENYFVKSKAHPNEIIDRLRYLLKT